LEPHTLHGESPKASTEIGEQKKTTEEKQEETN